MILRKLYLSNFLSHSESIVEFNPNGITAIIGENGSGKSSIIEAIQFALFGDSDKGNLENLIKWGKEGSIIELEFENKDGLFKIHREIVKTKKGANSQNSAVYKFEKGSYRLYYQKDLKSNLPKLIGFTKRAFQISGLIKQGEIEGFLRVNPAKRKELIEELLGIQYYKRLINAYYDKKKDIEDELKPLELFTSSKDTTQIQNAIEKNKKEIEDIKDSIDKLKDDLKDKEEYKKQIKEKLEKIKDNEGKIESNEYIKDRILNEIKELKEELSSIEKLEQNMPKLEENYRQYRELDEKYKRLKDFKFYLSKKEHLLKQKESIDKDISFKRQFEETAKKFDETKERLEEIEKELSSINHTLKDIEIKEKEKQDIEKDIRKKEEDLRFMQEFESIAQEYEQKEGKLKQISQYINQKEGELNHIKSQIEELNIELKKLEEELVKISEYLKNNYHQKFQTLKLNPLMIDEFINQNKIKIEKLYKDKDDISGRIKDIEAEGKDYKKKLENLESINDAVCPTCNRPMDKDEKDHIIEEINIKLNSLRNSFKELDKEIKKLEEEIKKQEEIKDKLTEFKNKFEIYKEKHLQKEKLEKKLSDISLEEIKQEKSIIEEFISKNKNSYARYITLKDKDISAEVEELKGKLYEIERYLAENDKKDIKDREKQLLDEKNHCNEFIQHNEENYQRYKYIQDKELLEERLSIEEELDNLDRYLSQYKEFETLSIQEIDRLEIEILEKIDSLKDSEVEYNKAKERISEKSKVVEKIKEKEKELEKISVEIDRLNNEIYSMDKGMLLLDEEDIENSIKEINENIAKLRVREAELNKDIERYEDELNQVKENLEKIKDLKGKLAKYENVIDVLNNINKLIRDNAVYMLPKLTEEIFSRFNFSNFSGLKFDDNYSIVLPVSNSLAATVESLSGGQKIALALALRFAISKMLNNRLEFLILDEPTIHMDRYRKRELVDLIGDIKEKGFVKQLIVVTHDDEIEERSDTIYKVSNGTIQLV